MLIGYRKENREQMHRNKPIILAQVNTIPCMLKNSSKKSNVSFP